MEYGGDIAGIIEQWIEDVFTNYDKDNSGVLDKIEAREYIENTLREMGETGSFSDANFEIAFRELDSDGNDSLSKEDLTVFIMKALEIEM